MASRYPTAGRGKGQADCSLPGGRALVRARIPCVELAAVQFLHFPSQSLPAPGGRRAALRVLAVALPSLRLRARCRAFEAVTRPLALRASCCVAVLRIRARDSYKARAHEPVAAHAQDCHAARNCRGRVLDASFSLNDAAQVSLHRLRERESAVVARRAAVLVGTLRDIARSI